MPTYNEMLKAAGDKYGVNSAQYANINKQLRADTVNTGGNIQPAATSVSLPETPKQDVYSNRISKSTEAPVYSTPTGELTTGITPLKVPKMEAPKVEVPKMETPKMETPTVPTTEAPIVPKVTPTAPQITDAGIKTTGIPEIDAELSKLRELKTESISDTIKSYNIAKGQFEQNKGYYTNFDDVNAKFEGVLGDLEAIQKTGVQPTDADYQRIATKYGIDVGDVKTPTNIFNTLELTDEGKQKTGVSSYEDNINKLTTDFERTKADINTNLEYQRQDLGNQINDTVTQLNRNIDWMEAQGAWSGAARSTGYQQGLENVREDGEKTIGRMQELLSRVEAASAKDLTRLTEDYNANIKKAKDNLDNQLDTLKFNVGLQLNGLEGKYGVGSKELTRALDAINEEFGTKSMDVFSKYISNMRDIQTFTNTEIENQYKQDALMREQADIRYNEYLADGGALLQNSTIDDLVAQVAQGNLSIQRFDDLQNMMVTGITNILSNVAAVDSTDMMKVKEYLASGMSPTEVIGEMSKEQKFQEAQAPSTQDWSKLSDNSLYNQRTGEIRNTQTGQTTNQSVSDINSIIDYSTSKRGRTNLQCGELVNDYWTQITGNRAGMGDTMDSKIAAIESIGYSETPVAGGVFASNPLGNNVGHTGIVQNVNPDGSITVLEANADGLRTGQPPVTKTYTAEQIAKQGMIFSQAPETKEEEITYSKSAQDWGQNIFKGRAKLSDIVSNPELRTEVSSYIANNKPIYTENDPMILSIDKDIKALESIVDWKEGGFFDTGNESLAEDVSGGIKAGWQSPFDSLTGERQQFLRKIQTVLDSQALKNLIDVKNMGATFGSLTEKEMAILQKSSSTLNASANRDDDGNIVSFTMDEEEFKQELADTLKAANNLRTNLLGENTTEGPELDEVDQDFFTGGGTLDQTDIDFFNNLP